MVIEKQYLLLQISLSQYFLLPAELCTTNSPIPRNRAVLVRLTVAQVNTFTRGRPWSPSWARWIYTTPQHPHFLNIYFNIALPSTPISSEISPHFEFPGQNVACISHLSHVCCTFGHFIVLDMNILISEMYYLLQLQYQAHMGGSRVIWPRPQA